MRKRFHIGVRLKCSYFPFIVVVALSSGSALVLARLARAHLEGAQQRRQEAVVAALEGAASRSEGVAPGAWESERVLDRLRDSLGAQMIAVFDRGGGLRGSSAWDGAPAALRDALTRYGRSNDGEGLQAILDDAGLQQVETPLWSSRGAQPARPDGTLVVAQDATAMQEQLSAIRHRTWLITLVAGACAAGLGLFLGRTVVRPVRQLIDGVQLLATVQACSLRFPDQRCDEVGWLARSFHTMSQAVASRREELDARRACLEQDVEDRTQDLRRAYETLRIHSDRQDAFLTSVSHELRTPLTTMRGMSEMIATYDDLEADERQEFVQTLGQEYQRLARREDLLRLFSSLRQGSENGELVRSCLVGDVVGQALAEWDDQGVVVEGDSGLDVSWRPGLVSRLLRELLINARRESPEVGTVSLTWRLVGDFVECRVSDQGAGIPEDDREQVFDPFHQLGDTLVSKPDGLGLGLPICREIARLHGGSVHLESNGDRGLSVVVSLQRSCDAAKETRLDEAGAALAS